MTTEVAQEIEVEETTTKPSSWYVSLGQLPGWPAKVRLEVLQAITAAVQQMPVSERRAHAWKGPRAAAYASEELEAQEDSTTEDVGGTNETEAIGEATVA
jgi:hypothetical protein